MIVEIIISIVISVLLQSSKLVDQEKNKGLRWLIRIIIAIFMVFVYFIIVKQIDYESMIIFIICNTIISMLANYIIYRIPSNPKIGFRQIRNIDELRERNNGHRIMLYMLALIVSIGIYQNGMKLEEMNNAFTSFIIFDVINDLLLSKFLYKEKAEDEASIDFRRKQKLLDDLLELGVIDEHLHHEKMAELEKQHSHL